MKFIVRCDATVETGLGHLGRCLGLSEAARDAGDDVVFVGHWGAAAAPLITGSGFVFHDAAARTGTREDADDLAQIVAQQGADAVLADSYAINSEWLARLASHGVCITLLDDFAPLSDYQFCAGVINVSVRSTTLTYPGLNPATLVRGPAYFQARAAVRQLRERNLLRKQTAIRRVLIALGGGDRITQTAQLYHAVRRASPGIEVRALVAQGPQMAASFGMDPDDFPEICADLSDHYAWTDACINGGGLVKYECAYLGLRHAILSQTPDQQLETDAFCGLSLGYDLTPSGSKAGWEQRLHIFLSGCAVLTDSTASFPIDSPDRALAALREFTLACTALERQLK